MLKKIMNSLPFFSTNKEKHIWKELFSKHDIEHLPICNEDRIIEKLFVLPPRITTFQKMYQSLFLLEVKE